MISATRCMALPATNYFSSPIMPDEENALMPELSNQLVDSII
jgi:hypothetical protein